MFSFHKRRGRTNARKAAGLARVRLTYRGCRGTAASVEPRESSAGPIMLPAETAGSTAPVGRHSFFLVSAFRSTIVTFVPTSGIASSLITHDGALTAC